MIRLSEYIWVSAVLFVFCGTAMKAESKAPVLALGDSFPTLKGDFLTGKPAVLPDASTGKVRLLLMGFTYASRFPVEAWTKCFRAEFEKNPEVTFCEIPMIGGMAQIGKWFIDSGMRRGTPKSDHENVITVYGGIGSWKQRLKVKDENTAHLILVDQSGKVVWLHSGPLQEMAYQALSSKVGESLAK